MPSDREMLAGWVNEEREQLIDFLQGFVRAKSANPPGDTRLDRGQPVSVVVLNGHSLLS